MPHAQEPSPPSNAVPLGKFHLLAWRWHFYASLYVIPLLLMLAITGLVMVFFTGFQDRLGMKIQVTPQAQVAALASFTQSVQAQWPHAKLRAYVAPKTAASPGWFNVTMDGHDEAVAVNPYTAAVIRAVDKEDTVFA